MGIRAKIILVVLPLIITTLLLTGASSFFSATNAIPGVAKEFLGFKAAELEVRPGERAALTALAAGRKRELATPRIGGADRVVKGFWFEPFGWYLVVSEQRATFYSRVSQITTRTLYILGGAILAGVVLIMLFANYLTRPLTKVVGTMEKIIRTGDLSNRVAVEYHDEIGKLAHTPHLMA